MATKKQAAKQPAAGAKRGALTRNDRTTRSLRARGQVEGPHYLVLADSYIDQQLKKAGDTVVYYGLPGRALRPINGEAKERKQAVIEIDRDEKLTPEQKQARKQELSDEWNGVVSDDLADDDFEFEDQLEAAEAQREADLDEADRRAELTKSGEANKGADGGPGAREAQAKYS